jgi:hypothetical protein
MDLKEVLKGGLIGLIIGIIGVIFIFSIMGQNSGSVETSIFIIGIPLLSFVAGAARASKKK